MEWFWYQEFLNTLRYAHQVPLYILWFLVGESHANFRLVLTHLRMWFEGAIQHFLENWCSMFPQFFPMFSNIFCVFHCFLVLSNVFKTPHCYWCFGNSGCFQRFFPENEGGYFLLGWISEMLESHQYGTDSLRILQVYVAFYMPWSESLQMLLVVWVYGHTDSYQYI